MPSILRDDLIFLYKILNNYFDTDFTDLIIYLLYNYYYQGVSVNVQDYYVDQITSLMGSPTIGIVYLIML